MRSPTLIITLCLVLFVAGGIVGYLLKGDATADAGLATETKAETKIVTREVPVEVVKEVPVEVIKEVPKEMIKEVPTWRIAGDDKELAAWLEEIPDNKIGALRNSLKAWAEYLATGRVPQDGPGPGRDELAARQIGRFSANLMLAMNDASNARAMQAIEEQESFRDLVEKLFELKVLNHSEMKRLAGNPDLAIPEDELGGHGLSDEYCVFTGPKDITSLKRLMNHRYRAKDDDGSNSGGDEAKDGRFHADGTWREGKSDNGRIDERRVNLSGNKRLVMFIRLNSGRLPTLEDEIVVFVEAGDTEGRSMTLKEFREFFEIEPYEPLRYGQGPLKYVAEK